MRYNGTTPRNGGGGSDGGGGGGGLACLQAVQARRQFTVDIMHDKVKDSEGMKRCMDDHSREWHGLDKSFGIEVAMVRMIIDAQAGGRISSTLLALFPVSGSNMKVRHVMDEVRAIIAKDGYKLLPVSFQNAISYSLTLLGAIEAGTTHTLKVAAMTKLTRELWTRCSFFMWVSVTCMLSGLRGALLVLGSVVVVGLVGFSVLAR